MVPPTASCAHEPSINASASSATASMAVSLPPAACITTILIVASA